MTGHDRVTDDEAVVAAVVTNDREIAEAVTEAVAAKDREIAEVVAAKDREIAEAVAAKDREIAKHAEEMEFTHLIVANAVEVLRNTGRYVAANHFEHALFAIAPIVAKYRDLGHDFDGLFDVQVGDEHDGQKGLDGRDAPYGTGMPRPALPWGRCLEAVERKGDGGFGGPGRLVQFAERYGRLIAVLERSAPMREIVGFMAPCFV